MTVGVMLIPQGMAYAYLAGLPPIYGLYAGLVPLIIYALLGTSRQLSLGPAALSSVLLAAGVSQIAEPFGTNYIDLVIMMGLLIGIVQVLLGLFRLGFFVNFLSNPVLAGFTSAAAIIIGVTQLKDALGINIPRFDRPLDTFLYAISHISDIHWITAAICFGSILIMILLRKIHKSIPGALIIVIIGILITKYGQLDSIGVSVLGEVPQGLPSFLLPKLDIKDIQRLIPTIATVSIIGVVECIGIAKVLEAKHKDYIIDTNQELVAVGFSKVIGSFFQAMPTSASFSRSAVNSDAGAKSTISTLITAFILGLTLFALTPLFYYLPKAILAAIILLAVRGIFNDKEAINLWKTHKSDFMMMLFTFAATLILGISQGVLFGALLSILVVLYKSSRPHISILGNVPGTTYYRNVNRYRGSKSLPKTMIIRFDDQLYFGNCNYFRDQINQFVADSNEAIKYILIDAGNIHAIDSSGIHILRDLDEQLEAQGIGLYLCRAIGPVRDMLFISGLMNDPDRHHMNIHEAVKFIKNKELNENHGNALATHAMQTEEE